VGSDEGPAKAEAGRVGVLLNARPKGQPDVWPTITCVARVAASYAFNGLADYQVCCCHAPLLCRKGVCVWGGGEWV
jgi:hypothetical protein